VIIRQISKADRYGAWDGAHGGRATQPTDRRNQLRPRQSPYRLAPYRLSGIRKNRLACPPQIVAVCRVVLHECGFDYERAVGRRVLALYAAITH
jgi:hypothetical protein